MTSNRPLWTCDRSVEEAIPSLCQCYRKTHAVTLMLNIALIDTDLDVIRLIDVSVSISY